MRGSGDASAARGPEARDDAAGAVARDARTGRASMSVRRRVRDASSSGSHRRRTRIYWIRLRHRRETCPFGEIPVTLRRRASMQYSRGGGTMSQMSVPAGAWEDLRREVRARNPAAPPRPPDATRASSRSRERFSRPRRVPNLIPRAAPPPPRSLPDPRPPRAALFSPPPLHARGSSQARKLEGEIDGKLSAFAKTASGVSRDTGDGLMAGEGVDAQAGVLESLLQRLTDVNAAMAGAVSGGSAGGEALVHAGEAQGRARRVCE